MKLKAIALGAVMALGAAAGAQAATTTYYANSTGPFTLGCAVNGILNNNCSVTTSSSGAGVSGNPDTNPYEIDNFPLSSETLIVTFDTGVILESFYLGNFDRNDDYEFSLNGGAFSGVTTDNPNIVGQYVTSFAIRASYDLSDANLFDGAFLGDDNFTLKKFTVTTVPLPAGGLLLLGGLGSLAALRRRKKAA